jgi:hypothetical protein
MKYLGAGLFFKNDHHYLMEWVEFHRMVGIEHFYMACHDDDPEITRKMLRPYIDAGIMDFVHLKPGPGTVRQMEAHSWFISQRKTRWIAVFDLDEFLFRPDGGDIKEVLPDYEHYGALCVHWLCYGSSGLFFPPPLASEWFTQRAYDNFRDHYVVKSIIQPEHTIHEINPHTFKMEPGWPAVDEIGRRVTEGMCVNFSQPLSYRRLRINHYRVRSYMDFKAKCKRWQGGGHPEFIDDFESYFKKFDTNDVRDTAIHAYVPELKKRLGDGEPKVFEGDDGAGAE